MKKSHRLRLGHLAAVLFLALFGPRRQCDRIASAAADAAAASDAAGASDGSFDVEVIMPPRETLERDSYLCTRVPLPEGRPEDATFSLVGFEPIAEKSKVHHMLLFGCQDGPSNRKDDVWDCKMRAACRTNDVVLYGWGLNAPAVSLPTGSGYTVGARSSNRYLVLQIHFMVSVSLFSTLRSPTPRPRHGPVALALALTLTLTLTRATPNLLLSFPGRSSAGRSERPPLEALFCAAREHGVAPSVCEELHGPSRPVVVPGEQRVLLQ